MGVISQTDPSNEKKATEKKIKLRKVIRSKKRSGRRDRYPKRPQECVVDGHTYGDVKNYN